MKRPFDLLRKIILKKNTLRTFRRGLPVFYEEDLLFVYEEHLLVVYKEDLLVVYGEDLLVVYGESLHVVCGEGLVVTFWTSAEKTLPSSKRIP